MDIAKSIRVGLAREAKNQTWLADQIGATRATASNYCNGRSKPDAKRIEEIAGLFGMSVSEFIAIGEK